MIILNKNGLLGDALSTLPAIWQAINTHEHVYLASEFPEVAHLLPEHPHLHHIETLYNLFKVPDLTNEPIRILDAGRNMAEHCVSGFHMVQGHFKYLDFPIPTHGVPNVTLDIISTMDTPYDFIVSPYSRSDHENNKLWPLDRWQVIIDWLREQNYSVAVVGSGRDDEPPFKNLSGEIIGYSLHDVAWQLKNVRKAVLSIDNGISHLTRIVESSHILLYPECLPTTWVSNPKALTLKCNPLHLAPENVKELITRVL